MMEEMRLTYLLNNQHVYICKRIKSTSVNTLERKVEMSVMVLDAGNSIIKAKIARRDRSEVSFPHALRQLTESEYQSILARSNTSRSLTDYMRINGQPYVIGESAERHGVLTQRNGTARYSRDYYGVLAAAALGRLYDRSREVSIFGSHPPGDVHFREDLMKSVIGEWRVELGGSERVFRVTYANTFDEPVGGLMNVLFNRGWPALSAQRSYWWSLTGDRHRRFHHRLDSGQSGWRSGLQPGPKCSTWDSECACRFRSQLPGQ